MAPRRIHFATRSQIPPDPFGGIRIFELSHWQATSRRIVRPIIDRCAGDIGRGIAAPPLVVGVSNDEILPSMRAPKMTVGSAANSVGFVDKTGRFGEGATPDRFAGNSCISGEPIRSHRWRARPSAVQANKVPDVPLSFVGHPTISR